MVQEKSSSTKGARLTRYQPGSLRELWAVSWPLMLASFSGSCMTFIDRAILARYQTEAFVACSAAQPWFWTIEGFLLSFVIVTEIFVGRFNGAREYKKIGPAVWQMAIFSLAAELFLLPIILNAHYLLADTVQAMALPYLQMLLISLPFDIAAFGAIGAFFVGRGDTKKIPIVLLICGCLNLILDIWFVFGGLGIPSMGIIGAALATNIAHIFGFFIFLFLFLQKKYREKYAIGTFQWSWNFFKQCVNVGMPNAIGCFCLMTGWSLCYQLLALHTSSLMFTAYSIAFTIFNVMFFVMDGMSKAVGTLCSNFIGAEQPQLMRPVLKQSCQLTFFFALFFLAFLFFANPMIRFFSSEELFANPLFKKQTFVFLAWYWLIFILDTLRFCAQYFMFALTKTKVVLIFNVAFCWGLIIAPTYYFIVKLKWNPIIYLQLSCLECFLLLVIFKRWFNKGTWMQQWKIKP